MVQATYPEVVPDKSRSGGQPWLTPPYLVLHCEEFAWPRMSPCVPVRSYIKPVAGRTVSPITPTSRSWFLFCCTCRHPNLRQDAPPLAGSLPCSVRTFLSWIAPAAIARPALFARQRIIARECSTGTGTAPKPSYPKYLKPTR